MTFHRTAVTIIDDSVVWHIIMDGKRRNRLEACLPRQAGTPVFPKFGISKWMAREETGWKPVGRDRRGRLSSQIMMKLSI
jgi:hypothetical protein